MTQGGRGDHAHETRSLGVEASAGSGPAPDPAGGTGPVQPRSGTHVGADRSHGSLLAPLSLVAVLVATVSIVYLVFDEGLFSPHPVVIALQVAAAGLMAWARITFGPRSFHAAANPTEGGVVKTGPYRYLRHPIYMALILFTCAGVCGRPSSGHLLAAGALTAALVVRALSEERLVRSRYPEYSEYARTTKRFVPFVI